MLGIRKELLRKDWHNFNVIFFGGWTIEDMENSINPILKRESDYIILHFETGNATNLTARDILDKFLQLKLIILHIRKSCKVIILKPTLRSHHWELNIGIAKTATLTGHTLEVRDYISVLYGNARLEFNLKATVRKLWSKFGNLRNLEYQSNVTAVSSDHNNFQNLNHCDKNQPTKSTFTFHEIKDESCKNSNRSNTTETVRNLRLENPNQIMLGQLKKNS